MFESKQKTLKKTVNFAGTGLHLGKKVSINLKPAEADTGIIFKRTDIKNNNDSYNVEIGIKKSSKIF